jgi:hypothetical protein
MYLTALMLSFDGWPNADAIKNALRHAYSLGHEFGVERAACVVDECNSEGPYNAIGVASRIRALRVVEPSRGIDTIGDEFIKGK